MTALAEFPVLEDFQDQTFDPFEVEKLFNGDVIDPWPTIHALREKGPVHKVDLRSVFTDVPNVQVAGIDHYATFGYDANFKLLTSPEIFSNREAFKHTLGVSFGRTLTAMDAPEHNQFRRIFQKAFLPPTIAGWGEKIVDPVVDTLMSKFIDRGEADLVEEFAHHYPFQVVYKQLQLSDEQGPIFHKLAIGQLLSAIGAPEGDEATGKLGVFFKKLVALRRAKPGDDIVSQLAHVQVDGEYLPDDVVISFLRQLINAGGDTTYRGTTVLLVGLLSNPDQLAAVRADRSLIPQAIEEALRWEGPILFSSRAALQDIEFEGMRIPKGAIVNPCIGSASRDPAKYSDPDKFDIFRERSVRLMAFAFGPHVCIGQHLARLEMTRALNALLDRLPNLRLDPNKPPPEIRGQGNRSPEHIHVLFDA